MPKNTFVKSPSGQEAWEQYYAEHGYEEGDAPEADGGEPVDGAAHEAAEPAEG